MSKPTYLYSAKPNTYYLSPAADNILKVFHWHFGFMSGNMYLQDLIRMSDIEDDLWVAHLKPLYRALISHGCVYLGSHYILGHISSHGNIKHLDVEVNDGYHLCKQIDMYKELDENKGRQNIFIKMAVKGVGGSLIGVKYYSSNKNTLAIVSELKKLYPPITHSPSYWMQLITALLLPKSILVIIRSLHLLFKSHELSSIIASIGIGTYLKPILNPHK